MRLEQRRTSGIPQILPVLLVGLGIWSALVSEVHASVPNDPIRPSISIDNEGPIAVFRHLPSTTRHRERRTARPDDRPCPWCVVIRLDLIVPVEFGPWVPRPPKPDA
jgi:hypothetical protein